MGGGQLFLSKGLISNLGLPAREGTLSILSEGKQSHSERALSLMRKMRWTGVLRFIFKLTAPQVLQTPIEVQEVKAGGDSVKKLKKRQQIQGKHVGSSKTHPFYLCSWHFLCFQKDCEEPVPGQSPNGALQQCYRPVLNRH